jgi:hypothetical protein
VRQQWGAEDFGAFAGRQPARHIHLPEAVAGGDPALGHEQVVEVGCFDVRDAVAIAADGDGRREAGEMEGAVDRGERGGHAVAEEQQGKREQQGEHQHGADGVDAEADSDRSAWAGEGGHGAAHSRFSHSLFLGAALTPNDRAVPAERPGRAGVVPGGATRGRCRGRAAGRRRRHRGCLRGRWGRR